MFAENDCQSFTLSRLLTIPAKFVIVCLFKIIVAVPMGVKWCLASVLVCLSLMSYRWGQSSFLWVYYPFVKSLEKCFFSEDHLRVACRLPGPGLCTYLGMSWGLCSPGCVQWPENLHPHHLSSTLLCILKHVQQRLSALGHQHWV